MSRSGSLRPQAELSSHRTMYRILYWLVLQRLPAEGTHKLSFALLRALVALPGVGAMMQRYLAPRDPVLRCSRSGSASSRSGRSLPKRNPATPSRACSGCRAIEPSSIVWASTTTARSRRRAVSPTAPTAPSA
jgi:hypothetical protein